MTLWWIFELKCWHYHSENGFKSDCWIKRTNFIKWFQNLSCFWKSLFGKNHPIILFANHFLNLKDINISFKDVDFHTQRLLILGDTRIKSPPQGTVFEMLDLIPTFHPNVWVTYEVQQRRKWPKWLQEQQIKVISLWVS